MLKLKNINKTYFMPNFQVEALKDINLSFRKNEFVSILGPSGSGKTTLLNLIGGLDQYTTGDLIINGRSTKTFKENDWDVYRNHRVGFVFQSYNLIPHQTVLGNVELALIIAGIDKEERTKRAKEALDRVGLADQYYKKPNQLSGGQSQRVAIARALVNDPEILLADEPTGALDTKTSKQIMDLIKEIASDRLVIMVTHNPELAEEYSTRIINLLDGELLDDSDSYEDIKDDELEIVDYKKIAKENKERSKMSWWTTFRLSLQNLISKRNRTILTSVASSIGIIGISLVLSLSFGVRLFISNMQEDMLSGNPITIETDTVDFERLMDGMGFAEKIEYVKVPGTVNVHMLLEELAKRPSPDEMFVKNLITDDYVNFIRNIPEEDVATIFYDYGIDIKNNLYMNMKYDDIVSDNMSLASLVNMYSTILMNYEETRPFASMISGFTNVVRQAPSNQEYLLEQYDIVDGKFATEKDELMLVVSKDRTLTDIVLAQLGYYSQTDFIEMALDKFNNTNNNKSFKEQFTYEELRDKTFNWYPNNAIYNKSIIGSEDYENGIVMRYNAYEEDIIDTSGKQELKIVGILEPKENILYGTLSSGLYYTEELTKHMIEQNLTSEIVDYVDNNDGEINNIVQMVLNEDFTTTYRGRGIVYDYDVRYFNDNPSNLTVNQQGVVGVTNIMSMFMGTPPKPGTGLPKPGEVLTTVSYTMNLNSVSGSTVPNGIEIYPKNLRHKENVLDYLSLWNKNINIKEEEYVTISDPLSMVFSMINDMIKIITIALIAFTSLSLLVSSVMIAIITYVSVVERIKEIGVIRSLGGRKRDVSNLFVAETVIIGLSSGLIAISFTYLVSLIANLIVNKRIGGNIASFPIPYALLMLLLSILLTLISGIIPSRSAAKKDPVVALRQE